jgi:16S rRNA (guanine966-N2)-methyltransferase
MRVIGGEFRSRRIQSMPGMDVRPTPDRLRETLFNILTPVIGAAVFVDAYAGSGAVGIEALSRGARHVVFIEKNRAAAELIRANLDALGAGGRARVVQGSAALHLGGIDADIVFLDPPYPKDREYGAAMEALEARRSGLVIFQHSSRLELSEMFGPFARYRVLRQGDNALSFYRAG